MPVRLVAPTIEAARTILHASARCILAGTALAALVTTAFSALGVLPWLTVSAGFERGAQTEAGRVAQVSITTLLCLLVLIVPSKSRMRALEQSHRDFGITIADVASAYHAAHALDCVGVFTLSSELNQMRERLEQLCTHPSLKVLEVDMLALAEPYAASVRAVIQVNPSGGEAAKVQADADADQVYHDDLASAPVHHEAEHAVLQISA